ncbi:MAG: DsbA family oxidoreductase [Bacteroidia bacterium]
MTTPKIKVEIWSDVMCPFCYIGKRKFEAALEKFPQKDNVQITWKSFQLSPDVKTDPSKNANQFLAEHKGISQSEAQAMHDRVTQLAASVGLKYDFNKAVVANSFKAHCFTHFAKENGKQPEAEEALFRSYFTEGKNIDDDAVLLEIGKTLGLDTEALKVVLENRLYSDEVENDIREAGQIGVRGVPFFVLDRKYAVSGAQDSSTFLEVLNKVWSDSIKCN